MTFVPKAPFLEDFKLYNALAGLLTCPRFKLPSHIFECSGNGSVKTLHRTYSSGSVQDFHLIPSSSDMPEDISETNTGTKIEKILFERQKRSKIY